MLSHFSDLLKEFEAGAQLLGFLSCLMNGGCTILQPWAEGDSFTEQMLSIYYVYIRHSPGHWGVGCEQNRTCSLLSELRAQTGVPAEVEGKGDY